MLANPMNVIPQHFIADRMEDRTKRERRQRKGAVEKKEDEDEAPGALKWSATVVVDSELESETSDAEAYEALASQRSGKSATGMRGRPPKCPRR